MPRYGAPTVGLAYSQDPDGTTVYPISLADDATTFIGGFRFTSAFGATLS